MKFAVCLLELWTRANNTPYLQAQPDFVAWSGACKDMLIGLGMIWDGERYVLPGEQSWGTAPGQPVYVRAQDLQDLVGQMIRSSKGIVKPTVLKVSGSIRDEERDWFLATNEHVRTLETK